MNAFECNVTPTRVRNAKSRNEDREPSLVVLGPFTPKTIVQFDEIPVSKTARRLIIVENPYKENLKVSTTKLPKPELNVCFEWTIEEIPASSKIQLEVVWKPLKVVSCREILQLTDNYGNKKDIAIILKSIELKKAGSRKLGSSNHPQRLKFKTKTPSPAKSVSRTTFMKKTTIYKEYSEEIHHTTKEPMRESLAPSTRTFASQNAFNCDSTRFSRVENDYKYTDKENTPVTPANASALFDSIKFTPATETKSKSSSKLEYLSSLPTPVGISRDNMVFTETATRRKLENDISPDVDSRRQQNENEENSQVIVHTETSRQVSFESPVRKTVTAAASRMPLRFSEDIPDNVGFQVSSESHMELGSETFLKIEDTSINEIQLILTPNIPEQKSFMSKTHLVSTPPSMPIISENEAMTNCTTPERITLQKTFNVAKQSLETSSYNVRMSESLREMSFNDDDVPVQKLRNNQGSMPNLNEMTAVTPIENNRYFFQKDRQYNQQKVQNLSMESSVSNTDFRDMEICAQSSRFNINEVGLAPNELAKRTDSPKSDLSTPPRYHTKNVPRITRESPTVRRVREEVNFKSPLKKQAQLLTISPPARSRFSVDVMEMHRRDTFVGTSGKEIRANTWKQQQNHNFQIPQPPRMSKKQPQLSTLSSTGNGALISQSLTSLSTLSLVSSTSTQSMPSTPKKGREYAHMYNAESHFQTYINPDPFAASTTCDPFLSSTMYLDEKSVDRIEKQFKKWLNALVTIPAELDSEVEKVDVGKLFNEVQNKELKLAPTRELVSSKYYKTRLDSLRAAGIKLYTSEQMRMPLTKLTVNIEKKSLEIRADRMIHLDLVLQRNLLELLLCFNPLWLRIGLEVVFGVQIELNSNQDVLGLSRFIITKMFKDPYLAEKYSKYSQQKEYVENLKKFTLKKFLFVIYFLDHAKTQRLIKHNPCLFVKKAPYKETNEILKKFASLVIANFGDILRYLKRLDYVLSHKQTYIDEFDYAFNNLAIDLRDGVRLNRVMEIILLRDDLTKMVRAPAISRLQKVYNNDCALKALQSADYQLNGDITAKDIADGHREKTLSMLWQIIYKFRAPRFNAAAITIQKFWRQKWLMVVIERRIKKKEEMRLTNAATVLQKIYRGNKSRQATKIHRQQRVEATIFIQKNVRRFLTQIHYQKQVTSIVRIQSWYRRVVTVREVRSFFIQQKTSTVVIQTWWRRQLLSRKLIAASNLIRSVKKNALLEHKSAIVIQRSMKSFVIHKKLHKIVESVVRVNRQTQIEHVSASRIQSLVRMQKCRKEYLQMRSSTIVVQTYWRALSVGRKQRQEYLEMKESTVKIQRWLRSCLIMKSEKRSFLTLRTHVVKVQEIFRGKLLMKLEQKSFQMMKESAINVQRRYRAQVLMRHERQEFVVLKQATIRIQQQFRATIAMKQQQMNYQLLKESVITVQKRYRATLEMRQCRNEYQLMRGAALTIQQQYRSVLMMRIERKKFQECRSSTINVQRQWRAQIEMKKVRKSFVELKEATIAVQQRFRANQMMKQDKTYYQKLLKCTIKLQQKFRATKAMQKQCLAFYTLQYYTMLVQRSFRATITMRKTREEYQRLKRVTITVQRLYRAKLAMKKAQMDYLKLRQVTITVQQTWRSIIVRRNYLKLKEAVTNMQHRIRANKMCKIQRSNFLEMKNAVRVIETRYEAQCAMIKARNYYKSLLKSVLIIQQRFRAKKVGVVQKRYFVVIRESTVTIQTYFRSYLLMKSESRSYQQLRTCTITIQQRFRARKLMICERTSYQLLRTKTVVIQRFFRAQQMMKEKQGEFKRLKSAAIVLQQRYRAKKQMEVERMEFNTLKSAVIVVQRRFRANIQRNLLRQEFLLQKSAAIKIQKYYRGFQLMNEETQSYQKLRECTIKMQRIYRGKILMKNEVHELNVKKEAILKIQRYWRATTEMRIQKVEYHRELTCVRWIQRKFRANQLMKQEVQTFNNQKNAAVTIQRFFRGYQKTLIVRKQFLLIKESVVVIQQRFRATQVMKYEMERFVIIRKSVLVIQRHFQATMMMRKEQKQFTDLKNAAIVIQQRFRANLMMRKERDNYRSMKMAVSVVETRYLANCEMRVERSRFVEMRQSAVTIQRTYRRFKEATDCRQRFINLKRVTIRLQTHIRGFIARKRYQELFTPEMIEARLRSTSARIIQASWRGFVVRRKKENRPLKAIAKRLQIAKQNADPTQTLGFKLKMSINFIIGKFNAMEAISVLVKLEYISRTIPSMLIGDAAFVSAFCYGLMAQAIRSEIDKQVIELCSCIILNLGRYVTTKEDAFQEQGLMTIAQMLLRWCDKDCGIFNTLCTLIWVFAHCDTKKKMIRKFMMQQDGSYVMSQIKMQVKRKENMRRNCRKPIGFQSISLHKYQKDYQLLQQNQHTSQYSSGFITPAMLQQCKQMPSFAPDYGVVKTKPYIFYSSVFAYDQILKILDIHLL